MADPRFDRRPFEARLATRRLGHALIARAETGSTNDDAWDALASGMPDGIAVVADAQTHGRGRAGRAWSHTPGLGLALSVGLHMDCDVRQAGAVPLAAGLALARALARLGAKPRLKWPNDVLLDERKVAGVLCEIRRMADGEEAVVIGIGVNVRQREADFAPELRAIATSLAIAGVDTTPEAVAAEFMNALEPLWIELQEGDRAHVLEAWSTTASFWGRHVTVRTPSGERGGIAVRLDADGALVLREASGVEFKVVAGDVALDAPHEEPA